MAKILDLNALEQPTLELTLRDTKRTTLRLTYPSTKLVERFMSASEELTKAAKTKNTATIKSLYGLTAEIISCNLDDIQINAEELRDEYGVRFSDLVVIFAAYLDFINELKDVKN